MTELSRTPSSKPISTCFFSQHERQHDHTALNKGNANPTIIHGRSEKIESQAAGRAQASAICCQSLRNVQEKENKV